MPRVAEARPVPMPRALRSIVLALLLALSLAPGPGAAQGGAQPDLVPSRLAARPANLTEGTSAVFDLEVRNAGNASSVAVNVSFFVDGALLGNATLAPLENATAGNATSPPWNATLGNHTISAVVDPEGALPEGDEGNNEAQLVLVVEPRPPPLPDLLVLDVAAPGGATLGANTTFHARLLNAGQGDAGPFVVRFDLDGKPLGNATVEGLPAGQAASVPSPAWNATGGNHTIAAVADAREEVDESGEDNNAFQRAFAATLPQARGPDLRVSEVVLAPEHPLVGAAVVFRALVENPGEGAGPFLVVFTLDNQTLGSERISGLDAGASLVVDSPPWNATAGDHELRVEADPGPGNDTALLNNMLPFRFRIPARTERPDLVVDLLVLPAVIAPGDTVRPAAVVRNNGSWPSPNASVAFGADGKTLGEVPLPGLQPGETARLTGPAWKATLGPHVVQARADAKGQVPESDEDNNAAVRSLSVPHGVPENRTALPDLAVAKLSWQPTDPRAGQGVVLRALVRNVGNGTVGPFFVEFIVDGQVLDKETVPGLGSVEVVVLSRPWAAKEGRHTLGVRLDAGDVHEEQEEANNVHYGVIVVSPAGLPFARSIPGPELALVALAVLGAAAAARRRTAR